MYDELVKDLREKAEFLTVAEPLNIKNAFAETMKQAADAIETMCEMVATAHCEIANVIQSYEESKPHWIPVTERLPEESEKQLWHDDVTIRFVSVWCCDYKTGIIGVRNRVQGKKTGIGYLDEFTKDADWHWSYALWEPTHWMPIVPLPEPPKEQSPTIIEAEGVSE